MPGAANTQHNYLKEEMFHGSDQENRDSDLTQTISTLTGDTYYKWRMDSQKFLAELITRAWAATYDAAQQHIVTSNANRQPNTCLKI